MTRGVGNAYAEVAFVGTDWIAYHCRMLDSAGSCPNTKAVGSGMNFVSIATVP